MMSETLEEQTYDNIIFELKLLSKIKKTDKLTTSGEKLGIDTNGYLQGVYRAYNGDSRVATLERIEKLCENSFKFLNITLKNAQNNRGIVFSVHQKNNINEQLKQMWLEMSGAIKGLENLKITYQDDASIESRIDLCIDKMKGYISDITNNLYSTANNVKLPPQQNIV